MISGQRGQLLIEAMLVLALSGILLAAGLGRAEAWRWNTTARQWSQHMSSSLADIRREAMLEGHEISLCATRDGSRCSSSWSGVWLAWHDRNRDGLRQADEALRQFTPPLLPGWQLHWRSFRNKPWLLWLASGDAAESNGTLTLCPPAPHDAALRQLVISKSGRIRLVQPVRTGTSGLQAARVVCGWP